MLITNVNIFDGTNDTLSKNMNVLIENNLIKRISSQPIVTGNNEQVIDGRGLTLMPGLLDSHVHTHFLLMPYLGQCSHFPPPPPNQVISVESAEPIDIQKLTANCRKSKYSFLWVSIEGKISLEATSHHVFRVDGMSWLESSYSVICHNINFCTPRDIAEVLAWQTREKRKSLYPKLTELISIDTGSN